MKKTIKQWSIHHNLNWYGPGTHGNKRYDYCIILEKGVKAFFSSTNKSLEPKKYETKNGTFLIFPNITFLFNKKEISNTQFSKAISWVKHCLSNAPTIFSA